MIAHSRVSHIPKIVHELIDNYKPVNLVSISSDTFKGLLYSSYITFKNKSLLSLDGWFDMPRNYQYEMSKKHYKKVRDVLETLGLIEVKRNKLGNVYYSKDNNKCQRLRVILIINKDLVKVKYSHKFKVRTERNETTNLLRSVDRDISSLRLNIPSEFLNELAKSEATTALNKVKEGIKVITENVGLIKLTGLRNKPPGYTPSKLNEYHIITTP